MRRSMRIVLLTACLWLGAAAAASVAFGTELQ